ncbi:MAG: MBL fold metallo-hydrolase, partial [Clostridia bacterium]|nr:MBL fold metallo-hydrolase [Clostridia bacterium]
MKKVVIQLYTHIKDNIYSIYVELPNSPLKNINAYLIRGKGRNLLIDTGFRQEACRSTLLLGLSELGVSMENTDIFLTHLHADHTGLASEIAGKDSVIFMGRDDYTWKTDSETPDANEKLILEQKSYGFSDENISEVLVGRSRYKTGDLSRRVTCIDDGTVLSYGGRELRAILTPGHTPGHMCLYDPADKIMFLGDHVLFDITPNIIAWRGFKDPLGTYVNSLLDIRGYEVD